jgi:uncharacterized protein DUF4386
MTSDTKLARLAAVLYLLTFAAGPAIFSGRQLISGDPAALLAELDASRTTFELVTVLGVVGFIDYLIVAVVFHRLFAPVDRTAANLLVAFVVASVPLSLAALARRMDVLLMLDSGAALREAEILLALQSARNLMATSIIFWGLWLIPLGWLVWRCGFLPRLLGPLLLLGAIYYVVAFFGTVLNSDFEDTAFARIFGLVCLLPGTIGEMGTALWLLIFGTRRRTAAAAAGDGHGGRASA